MRLLLVEDDKDLCDFVNEGLSREGFAVDSVGGGKEAVRFCAETSYDVVLLDVMIPEMDGFAVLKTLRGKGFKGAILLVTSKGQERDKLQGLNGGADDYLVKPFLLTELVARIRAVQRRTGNGKAGHSPDLSQATSLKVRELQMDLLKREVKRAGKTIELTKREFDLLECFMRRPSEVLSQTALNQQLTSSDFASATNTVEVHIKNLRAKIDPKSGPSLIRTVRGCGYSLDA
jgi:DNA-binding response OmpR family regulator